MPAHNHVELTGNLGAEPELRFTATGTPVAKASLAVHHRYLTGERWLQRTDWFRLVAFGAVAELLATFAKGERVNIRGRLQASSYLDREGVKRTTVEVVVLQARLAPLPPTHDAMASPAPVAEDLPPAPPPVVLELSRDDLVAPKPRRRRVKAAA
ncbi:single-stranded DNA-binding protein [Candidatus Chloroploca sp. Khr17]|uniref:single-stranded DNA-binding protein n=1 Tax=Candidatus Chloroploca sp. Khr17 TaxID=2496869 RepID=UPI00101B81F8|nr:single-stranded DNA-binding protein [Candidatus Chloroploca sp. Khr17]